MAFAAKHAEAVYIGGLVPSQASYQIKQTRDLARAAGRDPYGIKFFAAINPILGRTMEEAEAKFAEAKRHVKRIISLYKENAPKLDDLDVYQDDLLGKAFRGSI